MITIDDPRWHCCGNGDVNQQVRAAKQQREDRALNSAGPLESGAPQSAIRDERYDG
jgi:hypothetical protein